MRGSMRLRRTCRCHRLACDSLHPSRISTALAVNPKAIGVGATGLTRNSRTRPQFSHCHCDCRLPVGHNGRLRPS